MTWKPGQSGNPNGRNPNEKIFADALRGAVNQDGPKGIKKLRGIAEKLVECALQGEGWAIQQVADRLDGKPAQESTVNYNDKRDFSDWTRAELVALLHDAGASGTRAAPTNGRGNGSGEVH